VHSRGALRSVGCRETPVKRAREGADEAIRRNRPGQYRVLMRLGGLAALAEAVGASVLIAEPVVEEAAFEGVE